MWTDLSSFYNSNEWCGLMQTLKLQRVDSDGDIICEQCHKKIIAKYDCIGHHKTYLTLDNVNDANISLNPDNIALVCHTCHNAIHKRFGIWTRHIYLIHGSPCSGKATYVKQVAEEHDLIVDIDRIYACISNSPLYVKSGRIADNAFAVRDCLLDTIKTRRGRWINAYIIATMPYKGERERFCIEYGAEPIHIDCTQHEALSRLASANDGRNVADYTKYINQYYTRYQE